MIGAILGTLLQVHETTLLVDVNGVAYELLVAPSVALSLNAHVGEAIDRLYVYTHMHEHDLRLFAFPTFAAKRFFEQLLSVSGIGPQIALAITDHVSPEQFYQRVTLGDVKELTTIKGIGKKLAERIVLELKDKVPVTLGTSPISRGSSSSNAALSAADGLDARLSEAFSALLSLGYKRQEAASALHHVSPDLSLEAQLKQGLKATSAVKRRGVA